MLQHPENVNVTHFLYGVVYAIYEDLLITRSSHFSTNFKNQVS